MAQPSLALPVCCRYTALTELQIKPNPKNAKETAVAVQHEGERVLKVWWGWAPRTRRASPFCHSMQQPSLPRRRLSVFCIITTQAIQPSDRVILLDERGRDLSSEDLARLLAQVGRHRSC